MEKRFLFALFVSALFFSFARFSDAQIKSEKNQSPQQKTKPKQIAIKAGEPSELTYDAGTVRVLASSEDTNGAWSVVELIEMPGYKTRLHRHNYTDEAYYVLDGVLTARIADKTYELPAGSYIVIPRGTPHAQGNFGKVPVKVLLTMTPGGFEKSFIDRAELFKTVKTDSPDFRKKREELMTKGNYDREFLGDWDMPE
ncbi:MAG: cupin domain-containing protein [Pyrinomonadaceae bacterium]